MCGPLSPPGPFPAGPAQAPGAWISFTIMLVIGGAFYTFCIRRLTPSTDRQNVTRLYLAGILAALVGIFLMADLALPWMGIVEQWKAETLTRIAGICSTQPLDAIVARTRVIATILFGCGLVCFGVGGMFQAVAGRRYRHARSRPM